MNAMTAREPFGWYVVNALPNQEARAELNLRQQGFRAWLPAFQRTRRHARKVETVSAPLFPGYLFVQLDVAKQAWACINSTYGIRRLICRHDLPARLPDGFVDGLRAEVEGGLFVAPEDRLAVGDAIRVTEGPFADCVGRLLSFASQDRVTLLLTLLSREVSIVMPKHAVAAVV
ncbi:MAG TPA: transcriptional activator RfaH [Alphaproteobacteria bacterium]|jgi:transcriptional antiterminator RfaH